MNKEKIEVGVPVTGRYWSDSYPYEIIHVTPSGKTITIRELSATPTNNFDYLSNQEYIYSQNKNGQIKKARLTKQGWKTPCGMKIGIGSARKYEDPHF